MKMLKIIAVGEAQTASNGNEFKLVTCQALEHYLHVPGMDKPVEVVSNSITTSRTVWKGQDGLFDTATVGKAVGGEIHVYDVEPFTFTNRAGVEVTADRCRGIRWEGESQETAIRRIGKKPRTTVATEGNSAVEANENAAVVQKEIPA
jgi:hypothetical protein